MTVWRKHSGIPFIAVLIFLFFASGGFLFIQLWDDLDPRGAAAALQDPLAPPDLAPPPMLPTGSGVEIEGSPDRKMEPDEGEGLGPRETSQPGETEILEEVQEAPPEMPLSLPQNDSPPSVRDAVPVEIQVEAPKKSPAVKSSEKTPTGVSAKTTTKAPVAAASAAKTATARPLPAKAPAAAASSATTTPSKASGGRVPAVASTVAKKTSKVLPPSLSTVPTTAAGSAVVAESPAVSSFPAPKTADSSSSQRQQKAISENESVGSAPSWRQRPTSPSVAGVPSEIPPEWDWFPRPLRVKPTNGGVEIVSLVESDPATGGGAFTVKENDVAMEALTPSEGSMVKSAPVSPAAGFIVKEDSGRENITLLSEGKTSKEEFAGRDESQPAFTAARERLLRRRDTVLLEARKKGVSLPSLRERELITVSPGLARIRRALKSMVLQFDAHLFQSTNLESDLASIKGLEHENAANGSVRGETTLAVPLVEIESSEVKIAVSTIKMDGAYKAAAAPKSGTPSSEIESGRKLTPVDGSYAPVKSGFSLRLQELRSRGIIFTDN